MTVLSPYAIGDKPIFDPCEKCLVVSCCSQVCRPKMMYLKGYKSPEKLVATFKKRKRRKNK